MGYAIVHALVILSVDLFGGAPVYTQHDVAPLSAVGCHGGMAR